MNGENAIGHRMALSHRSKKGDKTHTGNQHGWRPKRFEMSWMGRERRVLDRRDIGVSYRLGAGKDRKVRMGVRRVRMRKREEEKKRV